VFRLFTALGTQWSRAGLNGALAGLRYEAIGPTARMIGVRVTPEMFEDLRIMEAEALTVFGERAERETKR